MKKKLRKITVDSQIYLWRFQPGGSATNNPADPWICHDLFTAYLLQAKNSPLRIHFLSKEKSPVRWAIHHSVQLYPHSIWINLHCPCYANRIIREALVTGWQPEQNKTPFVIEQGVEWLQRTLIPSTIKNIEG